MKKIKYYIFGALASMAALTSCDADFTEINKNPDTVYEVDPEVYLYQVENAMLNAGETWADSYACRLRWMQYCTGIWGYGTVNFTECAGWGGTVYGNYNTAGKYATHIPYYIQTNLPEQEAAYSNLIEVARVLLITKGIQTSDVYGSLAYTDAWGTRNGRPEILEPAFQTQEELYTIWNQELKEAANKLASATNQISFKNYDLAYNGDMTKWVKAVNAVRLRLALRLLNRKPEEAKAIAQEILSSGNIFDNIDDSFVLYFDNHWTTLGDWHSVIDMDRASVCFMNYLKKYKDPRKRLFFQINNLTPENVAAFNALETTTPKQIIPTNLGRWEGGHVSYDLQAEDVCRTSRYLDDIDMRPMNRPQTRLWKGAQDEGTAGGWVPLVTYADFCFMAAEFTLEGVTNTKSAQEWYEEGVRASLKFWSKIADYCKINNYEAITEAEIDEYMAQEGIAWNSAMAKEQIYCQTWIEHFKNNNESWAMYKRVGYPSTTSTLVTWEPIHVYGELQQVPRRKKFTMPADGSPNYANQVKRLEDMQKESNFGRLDSEHGRVWWEN